MIAVLNTRPAAQAAPLSALLRAAGFAALEVPLVELRLEPAGLAALVHEATGAHDGFLISSPSLIPLLAEQAGARARAALTGRPWYLISGKARAQAEALGARVAFAPNEPSLHGFLNEAPRRKRLRLLHLCSTQTRLDPDLFARRGFDVENLALYAPACPAQAGAQLQATWPGLQAVLLASGSAVHNLFAAAPALATGLDQTPGPISISIGASAGEALQQHGVPHPRLAPTADNAGLLAALKAVFFPEPRNQDSA